MDKLGIFESFKVRAACRSSRGESSGKALPLTDSSPVWEKDNSITFSCGLFVHLRGHTIHYPLEMQHGLTTWTPLAGEIPGGAIGY